MITNTCISLYFSILTIDDIFGEKWPCRLDEWRCRTDLTYPKCIPLSMRCDGVAQCGDLSDEEKCRSTESNERDEMEKDANFGLEFISNEIIEVVPSETEYVEVIQTNLPGYYGREELYEKCGGTSSSEIPLFKPPIYDKKRVYYMPMSKSHLPPIQEHLSSIEIFECCTVPNYFILGSMVCDGIAQCPDMSDECVCFFSSKNQCV